MPTQNEQQEHILPQQHTGIVDSGATYLYISPTAPHGPPDTSAATIKVGTADVSTCPLAVPTLIVAELVSGGPCGAVGEM